MVVPSFALALIVMMNCFALTEGSALRCPNIDRFFPAVFSSRFVGFRF
jgi:hypothetical protein